MYRQQYPDAPGMHNQPDSHSRTTYRSSPGICDRIRQSLIALIIGAAILLVSSGLLFWNEGRAVQRAQSLEEGLSSVVSLETTDVSFRQNNGKLVYFTGSLKTGQVLADPLFPDVKISAVKLKRNVEMFQWVEHEEKREYNDGSEVSTVTTYSYTKEWRSELIRSKSFDDFARHPNPESMPMQATLFKAEAVQVGIFLLSNGFVDQVTNFKPFPLTLQPIGFTTMKVHLGAYYSSHDPTVPQIGDTRVTFEYAGYTGNELSQPDRVSIIGRQIEKNIYKYITEAGDELELLYMGDVSAKEIFNREMVHNTILTWAIRFGGWLLMFIGFGCLTDIITTSVGWIPIIRDLVALGVGVLNLTLSISLSLTVIAVGWIRYRPWLGFIILVMAVSPFILTKFQSRTRSRSRYE